MKPNARGDRPRTAVRYSGRTADTASEETSVSRLTRPRRMTVLPTRRPRRVPEPPDWAPRPDAVDRSCTRDGPPSGAHADRSGPRHAGEPAAATFRPTMTYRSRGHIMHWGDTPPRLPSVPSAAGAHSGGASCPRPVRSYPRQVRPYSAAGPSRLNTGSPCPARTTTRVESTVRGIALSVNGVGSDVHEVARGGLEHLGPTRPELHPQRPGDRRRCSTRTRRGGATPTPSPHPWSRSLPTSPPWPRPAPRHPGVGGTLGPFGGPDRHTLSPPMALAPFVVPGNRSLPAAWIRGTGWSMAGRSPRV